MGQQFSSSRLSLPPRQPKEPCDPLLALCPCCERRTDNLQQADICLRHVINCPKHALDCPIHSVRNINREEKSDEFILNTDRLVLSNGRQLLIERQITDDISNLNSECRFLYAENLNARNPENLSLSFERQESSIDKHLCSCCNSKIADLPLACRCLQSLAGASNACSLTPGIKVISEKNKQKSFDSLSCFSSRTKDSSENLAAERTSDCECTHVKKLKKIRSKSQESISHSDNHSLPPVYCCTCPVDRSVQSTLNSRRNTEASSSGCEECFMPLNRGDNDKCVNKVHHSKHSQVRCCRFTNSANRFGCSVDDESVQNYNFIKMSDDQSKHCDCCCGSVKTCDSPKEDEDLSSSSVAGPSSAVNKNIVNNNELLEEDHDSDLTLNRCVKSSSIDRYMSALSVDRSRRKRHDENKHSSCSKKLDMSGEDSKTSKVVKKKRGILSKICRQKNAAKFEPNVATSSKDPEACICTLHQKTSSIDVLPIDSVSPTESGTGEVSGERQSSADNDNSNAGRNLINITVARLGSHGSSNPVYGTIQGSNHLNYIVDSNGNSSNSVFVLSVTASGSEVCRLENWRPPTTASSNPLTTVSAASSTGAGEERDRRSSQTSADIDNEESARERRAMEIIEGVEIGYKPDSSMVNCPWSVGIGQQHQLVLDGQQPLRIVLETSARIHTTVDYIHCLVPDLRAITACSFYWGKMDRYEAERLLENRPEGTFLLRDSAQEEYLFSVSFRKYNRSLHARIEQFNHRFSFDSHDPGVYAARTVTGLIEHYKDPACVMFFEPMLTAPLSRTRVFPLQHLCRAVIASSTDYDGVGALRLPPALKAYLKEYHYRQRVRITRFDVPHQEV